MKKLQIKSNDGLIALSALYCTVAVAMNWMCMKALSFGTSFIWMDGGLLISWVVFLTSTIITEVYGKEEAIKVSTVSAIISFVISTIAAIEVYIPTLPEYAEQAYCFSQIFSNGPRTIISSVSAFWLGNVIHVEIIDRLKQKAEARHPGSKGMLAFRSVVSTVIGQFCDNALFQYLAFMPLGISAYEMGWMDIFTCVVTGTILETIVESFFIPFITIPVTAKLQQLKSREIAA